jgi:hypothetical protein
MIHPASNPAWIGNNRDIIKHLRLAGEAVVLAFPAKFILILKGPRRQRSVVINLNAAGTAQAPTTTVNQVGRKSIEVDVIVQSDLPEISAPRHLNRKILLDECYQRHALAASFPIMVGRTYTL